MIHPPAPLPRDPATWTLISQETIQPTLAAAVIEAQLGVDRVGGKPDLALRHEKAVLIRRLARRRKQKP
jgi:hypothetical protein